VPASRRDLGATPHALDGTARAPGAARTPPVVTPPGIRVRPAVPSDLDACADTWRAGLDGYGARVGRPPLVGASGPIVALLGHLRETDPGRFLVAVRDAEDGERVVAFVSALRRAHVWFLAMLFVRPDEQARGLGRRLLEAVLPSPDEATALATCTDAAQPVSNALYARHGIVPRLPVIELVGRPDPARLPALPDGVRAVPFELLSGGPGGGSPDGPGRRHLAEAIAALDGGLLGYAHPEDHAFLAATGRLGYLYQAGDGQVLGYGYTSTVGRIGPVAVREEALFPGVLGHLLAAVTPAGVFSTWVPGAAGAAMTTLLEAGLRIEDFPALLCWDRPFADFARYLPITLAVL
jgi:GNAT superfamily N-acetyltransferase